MTTQPFTPSARIRRARAVYGTMRRPPRATGLVATELCLLAAMALAVAGLIGLRAWLAL